MSTPHPRSDRLRVALRLATATALLALAFRLAIPEDGRPLAVALADAWTSPLPQAMAWFALACGLFGANFAAAAARFAVLLRGAGLAADWRVVFRAYLVANFLSVVLPTAFAGDVYRFADARRDTGRGAEVLGVLALERLLSLAALGGIVLLAAPLLPRLEGREGLAPLVAMASAGLLLAAAAAVHPRGNALLGRAAARLGRVSRRLAEVAGRSLEAVRGLAQRPGRILGALALSFLCQALPVGAVLALSGPLDARVAWTWFAVIVPFVTAVSLVPVSIGGAGVRESLYVALFGAVGMRPEVALSLSLSAFAATLAWGLLGLALFARGRRGRSDLASRPGPVG